MKSITIHDLDDSLASRIRERAEQEGLSLNETIKKLLCKALAITDDGTDHRQDFMEFLGAWSGQQLVAFNERIKGFGEVNAEDWQ